MRMPRDRGGMWVTCTGVPLHDALHDTIRQQRTRGLCPTIRFLPGTHFTDGEFLYEVVYGCQGLGVHPAGWVAAVRTDLVDNGPPARYAYHLFSWEGKHRDGVIIVGRRRPCILRLVKAAPARKELAR